MNRVYVSREDAVYNPDSDYEEEDDVQNALNQYWHELDDEEAELDRLCQRPRYTGEYARHVPVGPYIYRPLGELVATRIGLEHLQWLVTLPTLKAHDAYCIKSALARHELENQ